MQQKSVHYTSKSNTYSVNRTVLRTTEKDAFSVSDTIFKKNSEMIGRNTHVAQASCQKNDLNSA